MGWKEKFISKAERKVLIKVVAQAIPTYTMSLFKIPKAIENFSLLWLNINGVKQKMKGRSTG